MLVENELKRLKTADSNYFNGKNHFVGDDDTQYFLVFLPMYKYLNKIDSNGRISAWKSKRLSLESVKTPNTSNNTLNPSLYYDGAMAIVKFNGSCLKQDKITCTLGKIVNIYMFMKQIKIFL